MRNLLTKILFMSFIISCGAQSENSENDDAASLNSTDFIEFAGFVGGVFEIEVDGINYADSETYYTEEMNKLPEKLEQAGYVGYEFELDAEVGFEDLWNSMTVYISPTDKQGFQGRSEVNREGAFAITLPAEANDQYYKVKANKRINLILTKGDEVKKTCFNFSAIDKSVPFSDSQKPIVLTEFVTRISAYECTVNAGTGIEIPENEGRSDYGQISKGMSKSEVLKELGDDFLIVESSNKWCWNKATDTAPVCSSYNSDNCQCSVTFDEDGLATSQTNIKSSYLDIVSW